jgi:hypothetical protein
LYSSVLGLQGDGFRRDTENPREAGGTIVAGGAGADAFVFAPSVLAAPNPSPISPTTARRRAAMEFGSVEASRRIDRLTRTGK